MHPSLGRGGKGEGHDCVLGICQNVPCRQNIKQTSSTVKDTNIEQPCNGMPGLCAHTSILYCTVIQRVCTVQFGE